MNKKLIYAAAAVIGVVLTVFVYKCPIKAITGIPCPGCGMTRACIMAFYDIKGAFYMHPLFPMVFIGAAAALSKFCRGYLKENPEHCAQMIIFMFAAVYIWRMLVVFPEPPMCAEEENFFKAVLDRLN